MTGPGEVRAASWVPGTARVLGEEQLAACWEHVDRAGGRDAFEAVVLGGSLACGMGHALSDVDLFVVPADGRQVDTRVRVVDGVPVQFNLVERTVLEDLGDTLESFTVAPEDRSQLERLSGRWRLASRLHSGRVLWQAPGAVEALAAIRSDVLRKLAIADGAANVARYAEDAFGATLSGDALLALGAAQAALRGALEVALAASAPPYVGESFTWRRLVEVGATRPLAPAAWDLLRDVPAWGSGPGSVETHARRMLAFATHVVSYAQLEGWDGTAASLPAWVDDARPPHRNPFCLLLRYAESIAINAPDAAYRSNEATARAWLSVSDGRAGDLPGRVLDAFRAQGLVLSGEREREEVKHGAGDL